MAWTPLRFGKHSGKTLPQVVFADPDWFFWAWDERIFERKGPPLANEARLVNQRARAIRVPRVGGQPGVAAYYLGLRGTVEAFDIVRATDSLDDGAVRVRRIDLSLPRRFKGYDKAGGRIVVDQVRYSLFGDRRLTRRRCEEFFDNATNFVAAGSVRWKLKLRKPKRTTKKK